MQTALLQLLEGVGLMGALPRTFPLRARGGRRICQAGFQSRSQTRVLTGIKVAIHALKTAVSYALKSS